MQLACHLFTAVTTLSFIVVLANFVIILYMHRIFRQIAYQDIYGAQEDDPHLEALPGNFAEVSMIIQTNHKFSLVDDDAWANLLPGKRGFVRLGPNGHSFGTALYHQLHCVNSLRFSYTVARDGLITDPDILYSKIGHDNHCFQFIRQSILCTADSALIALSEVNRNQTLTISQAGFGSLHRCKNWAQIRQYVLENDAKWDGIPYQMDKGMV